MQSAIGFFILFFILGDPTSLTTTTTQSSLEAGGPVLVDDGRLYNWGASYNFKPAVVVEITSAEEIVNVVKDTVNYPSPVRPYGKES